MQDLGIVIPVYGRTDMLKQCLTHLPRKMDVYIVDDCSPQIGAKEDIMALAKDYGAKYFRNKKNLGFPGTANKGIQKCTASNILLLNSDVMLYPGAVEVLLDEFTAKKNTGIVTPMLVFPPDSEWGTPNKIQHVGMAFNIVGMPIHLFIGWSQDNPRAVQRRDGLSCVTGACMMFSRALWQQQGGFSEVYGKGTFEDVEFCIRTKYEYKLNIVMTPEARGDHYVAQSAKGSGGYPLNRNFELFRIRNNKYVKNDDFLFL